MFTAIISILENKNFNSFYDFYLLISEDFSKKYQQKFLNLEKKYSNIKINFTNMKKSFSALNQMVSHITSPTYYRLKMSEILPATYDKVIYLDVDTIILTDLSEYFNIDISDNYIAGTIAAGYIMNWEERKDYYTSIGLPSTSQYINAGVTLWNLKKIREENLTEKMCELAKNNYETVDQDVVNLLFYNNIKHVPLYYNVMTKYKGLFDNTLDEYEKLVEIYSEKDIKTALSAPKIIHFADRIKPWDNSNIEFADMWIKYYNLHPFSRCCKRSLFSIVNIKNNKRKAIYKVVTFLGIKLKFKHKSRTAALRAKEASQKALA